MESLPTAVVAAFTVTANGVDLDIDEILLAASDALNIRLPTGTTIGQNQTVTVSYDKTAAGTDALEDAAENEVASFTDFAVTNNSTVDATPPSPESAAVATSGTSVTVTFDEDLDIAVESLPTAVVAAFTVTANGVDLDIDEILLAASDALNIRLPTGTTIGQNQTVTVSYDKTAAGTDALEDAAENEVASFTDFAATNKFPPWTPPPRARKARQWRRAAPQSRSSSTKTWTLRWNRCRRRWSLPSRSPRTVLTSISTKSCWPPRTH